MTALTPQVCHINIRQIKKYADWVSLMSFGERLSDVDRIHRIFAAMMQELALLHKYDVPVPRYTSYPTVPAWQAASLTNESWMAEVVRTFSAEQGELCIYIHLPFCEELCTYCACNKRITKNHAVEEPYLETVLREWAMYRNQLPAKPVIREIHLGGGTPTFFSPEHLTRLITEITKDAIVPEDHAFSVEVHPNYTRQAHLEALRNAGFNRISMGVQDFDPAVQFIINRIQTFEQTKFVVDAARALGYSSVNFDLIYGLPQQTVDSIALTMQYVQQLMPDRIAFYSYAHVPWKSKGQRRYTDEDVPKAAEKLAMYAAGSAHLQQLGYVHIGMDHFALPGDGLLVAHEEGKLHRNFMGYTTTNHKLVIGLGASAIGDTWTAFAQNEKEVERYQQMIGAGQLPIINGHLLSPEDLILRNHILDLMCRDTTRLIPGTLSAEHIASIQDRLAPFIADGLATYADDTITVTPAGKLFIRNISSALDAHLHSRSTENRTFSKAI